MRRHAFTAAVSLAAALLFLPAVALSDGVRRVQPTLEGRYLEGGDSAKSITITLVASGVYHVVADQWEGVGLFDGTSYWGVFRLGHPSSESRPAGTSGTQRGVLTPDGSLAVHGEFTSGRTGSFDTVWRPEHIEAPPPPPSDPSGYVYVEELPEALTKVKPNLPQAARDAGIEGTVLVQALVGKDGRVKETKIVHSVSGLDEAAVDCVRQWVFQPARSKGEPVAVWVAVPVRFSLR